MTHCRPQGQEVGVKDSGARHSEAARGRGHTNARTGQGGAHVLGFVLVLFEKLSRSSLRGSLVVLENPAQPFSATNRTG